MPSQETCARKLREETEKHAEFQDWEDAASTADGASTRPMSSAGTPLPQPKINLKFGGRKSASRAGTDSIAQSDDE